MLAETIFGTSNASISIFKIGVWLLLDKLVGEQWAALSEVD